MRLTIFLDLFLFTICLFMLTFWIAKLIDAIDYAIRQWFRMRSRRQRK